MTESVSTNTYSGTSRFVLELSGKIGSSETLCRALMSNLEHESPEVRWKCLEAAGAVAPAPGFITGLNDLVYHHDWLIRQALINAVSHMISRGVVPPGDPVLKLIDQLIPTCTDFTPTFPLKRALNELNQSMGTLRTGEHQNATITGDACR